MRDVIQKLTPKQALEVLMNLSDKGGAIRDVVAAEAKDVLGGIDLEVIADDVYFALDMIDVQDCWDRAGRSRDGYTSPDEAAVELVEAELQPFIDQVARYRELGMTGEEATFCKGVILGIYRYAHESKSEFREWSVDIPIECAGGLLSEWQERGQEASSAEAMDAFIRERCPNWARNLLRTGRRN